MTRLAGFGLMARDVAALAEFYCDALGFVVAAGGVRLGDQAVFLREAGGADYPSRPASNDPWFQHLAIVVGDIGAGYQRAEAHGAAAISEGGPRLLPEASGGVTAWKFRDPEGHPLELLEFPAGSVPAVWRGRSGLFWGIDHSAIVVRDTAVSLGFYEKLGFERMAQTRNVGVAQGELDGLVAPDVLVTAVGLAGQAAPHIEFLEYISPVTDRALAGWDAGDVVATEMVLAASEAGVVRDPDGHFVRVSAEF